MVATVMTMVPLVANLTVPFLAKRLGKRTLYSVSAGLQLAGLAVIFIGTVNTSVILAVFRQPERCRQSTVSLEK